MALYSLIGPRRFPQLAENCVSMFYCFNFSADKSLLDVLDEILNLIESVSEGFPSYSFIKVLIETNVNI